MTSQIRGILLGSAVVWLSLGAAAGTLFAQQTDTSSVAEAARKAREQKKNAPKPVRTLTDDDLPPKFREVPAPAPSAPATQEQSQPDQGKSAQNPAGNKSEGQPAAAATKEDAAQKRAGKEAALKRAKEELALNQGELDVLQRKMALDSDAYYSKVDYAHDTQGKALLDSDAQKVNDKKAEVEKLKARIAELEAALAASTTP